MGHLIVRCDNCGTRWNIYHRDIKNRNAKTCPMCGESINQQTWEKELLPAFGAMEDANRELFKDHTGYHGTLFTVAYEPDVLYPNRDKESDQLREEVEELRDDIERISSVVAKIINSLDILLKDFE